MGYYQEREFYPSEWLTEAKMNEIVRVALATIDEKAAELAERERPVLADSEWIADV